MALTPSQNLRYNILGDGTREGSCLAPPREPATMGRVRVDADHAATGAPHMVTVYGFGFRVSGPGFRG